MVQLVNTDESKRHVSKHGNFAFVELAMDITSKCKGGKILGVCLQSHLVIEIWCNY